MNNHFLVAANQGYSGISDAHMFSCVFLIVCLILTIFHCECVCFDSFAANFQIPLSVNFSQIYTTT